ncbi:DUF4870 domain-containing protein [Flavobacterium sp. MFBS3-15]|uniref:DUF4870 domain-containing protein n=1 Tax=Flavobacterium sp. MFBS3-15 TaxID=2989816 RepID=UPI00223636A2|nr:DUF4870 domain-containing protein [Flavobacterium sp. MFBS3-15]MCW4467518.1 DUF4870 domain-containing protein [Flavobacterium sp. MFBS3-15]
METTSSKNTSVLLQLSALSQYIFPLGNFIFPTLIWSIKKHESKFVDENGKQAINFQLSLLMYSLVLGIIAVPIFIYTLFSDVSFKMVNDGDWVLEELSAGRVTGLVIIGAVAAFIFLLLKVAEFFLIIYAAVKNSNGENYRYPLTINFIK